MVNFFDICFFEIVRVKEVSIQKAKHMEKYPGNRKASKYSYLNEIHTKHKMKNLKCESSDADEEYLIEETGKARNSSLGSQWDPIQSKNDFFFFF